MYVYYLHYVSVPISATNAQRFTDSLKSWLEQVRDYEKQKLLKTTKHIEAQSMVPVDS